MSLEVKNGLFYPEPGKLLSQLCLDDNVGEGKKISKQIL